MDESLLQQLMWVLLALGAVAVGVLGHWPRLRGRYHDGDHVVTLEHRGPVLWGEAQVRGGKETYLGVVVAGRIRLRRYDWGQNHLGDLGFGADTAATMDGACTGTFVLERGPGGALTGQFVGRRLRIEQGRLKTSERLAPVPRTWQPAP